MSAKDTDYQDDRNIRRRGNDDDQAESKSPSGARDRDSKGDSKVDSSASRGGRETSARKSMDDGGGWFDSSPKKGRRNKIIVPDEPDEEEEVMQSTRRNNKHEDDEDDDIIIIPDLDEDGDGGFGGGGDSRVAQAPRNVIRKIPTLDELERDVQSTMPTVSAGGYDLAVLTSTLVPNVGLLEVDESWDFDGLLREVTDQLTDTPKTVVSATISASMAAALAKEKKAGKSTKKK
jgi:hypothetical protein